MFGDAAAGVLEFGKTSAKALGQSTNEALGAAATYGNLFRSMGLGQTESAKMSTSLVKMAGDLASFNNVSPTEALDALRAGLVGEAEPLKRFGVNLNEASLQAEAMRLGLSKGKETLSAAAKSQAAFSLITKQTSLAQGDFARTSGGLANQQRILSAQFENVKARLGSSLMPVMQGAVSTFASFLPVIEPLLPILVPLAAAIGAVVIATKVWSAVQTALNVILAANPIGLIVLGIAALVAGVILAYQHSQTFRDVVQAAWDVLKGVAGFIAGVVVGAFGAMSAAVGAVVGFISSHWPTLLAILTGPIGLAVKFITDHLDSIVGFVTGLPGRIARAAVGMWDGIKDAFRAAINWVIRKWNSLDFTLPSFEAFGHKVGGFTLGTPDIPLLHKGGIFRVAGREGLALLEDGEGVFTRAQMRALAPIRSSQGPGLGQSARTFTNYITVHNPVPERASESVPRELRRLEFLLAR